MPRYFFVLHNRVEAADDEGIVLPDLSAARAVALRTIGAVIGEEIASGGRINLGHSLEILDEDRRPVLLLPFRELVES